MNLYKCIKQSKNFLDRRIASIFALFPVKQNNIVLVGDGEFRDNIRAFYDYLIVLEEEKNNHIIIMVDNPNKYLYLNRENVTIVKRNAKYPLFRKNYFLSTSGTIIYTHGIPIKKRRAGQLFIHTTHSASQLKAIPESGPRQNGDTYRKDYHLRCGEEGQRIISEAWKIENEKLPIIGMPRLDILYKHKEIIRDHFPEYINCIVVLVMETFRFAPREGYFDSTNESDIFGMNVITTEDEMRDLSKYLKEKNIVCIIKPHPKQDVKKRKSLQLENIIYIDDNELEEKHIQLYELVENCHALLTDYSSIFYDYLLLDRPIGFLISDIEQYRRGFVYSDPLQEMPGEKILNYNDLINFFDKVKNRVDEWTELRSLVRDKVFKFQDDRNCERLLQFIKEHRKT